MNLATRGTNFNMKAAVTSGALIVGLLQSAEHAATAQTVEACLAEGWNSTKSDIIFSDVVFPEPPEQCDVENPTGREFHCAPNADNTCLHMSLSFPDRNITIESCQDADPKRLVIDDTLTGPDPIPLGYPFSAGVLSSGGPLPGNSDPLSTQDREWLEGLMCKIREGTLAEGEQDCHEWCGPQAAHAIELLLEWPTDALPYAYNLDPIKEQLHNDEHRFVSHDDGPVTFLVPDHSPASPTYTPLCLHVGEYVEDPDRQRGNLPLTGEDSLWLGLLGMEGPCGSTDSGMTLKAQTPLETPDQCCLVTNFATDCSNLFFFFYPDPPKFPTNHALLEGNCFGRCGPGCGTDGGSGETSTQFTLDCADLDFCLAGTRVSFETFDETNSPGDYSTELTGCLDEWVHTIDDRMWAPNCHAGTEVDAVRGEKTCSRQACQYASIPPPSAPLEASDTSAIFTSVRGCYPTDVDVNGDPVACPTPQSCSDICSTNGVVCNANSTMSIGNDFAGVPGETDNGEAMVYWADFYGADCRDDDPDLVVLNSPSLKAPYRDANGTCYAPPRREAGEAFDPGCGEVPGEGEVLFCACVQG